MSNQPTIIEIEIDGKKHYVNKEVFNEMKRLADEKQSYKKLYENLKLQLSKLVKMF